MRRDDASTGEATLEGDAPNTAPPRVRELEPEVAPPDPRPVDDETLPRQGLIIHDQGPNAHRGIAPGKWRRINLSTC